MPSGSGGQFNPMMMKMESNVAPMDHQPSYSGQTQQMSMVQGMNVLLFPSKL